MDRKRDNLTWMNNKGDVVTLENRSQKNFILEMPTGRYRLDAGRRMRTMAILLEQPNIKALVDRGELVVSR